MSYTDKLCKAFSVYSNGLFIVVVTTLCSIFNLSLNYTNRGHYMLKDMSGLNFKRRLDRL